MGQNYDRKMSVLPASYKRYGSSMKDPVITAASYKPKMKSALISHDFIASSS